MPRLSGGWQHNYKTKTRQAGYATEECLFSAVCGLYPDTNVPEIDSVFELFILIKNQLSLLDYFSSRGLIYKTFFLSHSCCGKISWSVCPW